MEFFHEYERYSLAWQQGNGSLKIFPLLYTVILHNRLVREGGLGGEIQRKILSINLVKHSNEVSTGTM